MLGRFFWLALGGALMTGPAHAYIGPGAGVGTIMVAIALILGLLLLLFGFVWYPLRRYLRNRNASQLEDRGD